MKERKQGTFLALSQLQMTLWGSFSSKERVSIAISAKVKCSFHVGLKDLINKTKQQQEKLQGSKEVESVPNQAVGKISKEVNPTQPHVAQR